MPEVELVISRRSLARMIAAAARRRDLAYFGGVGAKPPCGTKCLDQRGKPNRSAKRFNKVELGLGSL